MSCGTVAPEVSPDLPSTREPLETVTATIAERQIDTGSDSAASGSESEQVMLMSDNPASFTEASAAKVAVAQVSQTQHMLYGDDVELAELTTEGTTPAGRRALRALVDAELAPVRNALATAPPATTWFVVRPLTVKVPVLEPDVGRARTTVWTVELFSRVVVVDPKCCSLKPMWCWCGTGLDGWSMRMWFALARWLVSVLSSTRSPPAISSCALASIDL